jgi:formate hydrogenlyase subunit 6/NADH:ubiquinone oxidoreductase subunit I
MLALIKNVLKNLGKPITIDYPAGTWPGNKYSQVLPYGRGMHEFDSEKCTGCGACVAMCPNKSIKLIGNGEFITIAIDLGRCMFCGMCQDLCPEGALKLTPKYELSTKDREKLYVKNSIDMARCKSCGKIMYSEKQIDTVKNRVLKNLMPENKEVAKLDMEKYLSLCPDCRKTLSLKLNTHPRKFY